MSHNILRFHLEMMYEGFDRHFQSVLHIKNHGGVDIISILVQNYQGLFS